MLLMKKIFLGVQKIMISVIEEHNFLIEIKKNYNRKIVW